MKYKCNECCKAGEVNPCILEVKGADFSPKFCPFDSETAKAEWKKVTKETKGEKDGR